MAAIQRGSVAVFRSRRGFGFITPDHNCGDLFVAAEDVADDDADLVPGEAVEYRPEVGVAGQLRAVAVRRVDRSTSRGRRRR